VELDDPELTARKPDGSLYANQPLRVVVGKRELKSDSRVFSSDSESVRYETHDLDEVMQKLFERGIRQVFVEGGGEIESRLIALGLADEFLIYLSPKLLGQGHGLASIGALAGLDHAPELQFVSVTPLGPDLRILARPVAA
jgi:diaminohydroxyphosphoribosylaminopyrimidine deaminase/5-amino-6-(5-phosphoribosylamino)uracil reductase